MPYKLENWREYLPLICLSGLLYSLSYIASLQLNTWFEFSHATSWFYLPSGVRLLLVLIMLESGALGIVLGTLMIDYLVHDSKDHWYNFVTALVAGASAYLSLKWSQVALRLDQTLARLKQIHLLQVCVIFSIVSPLMHQLWYMYYGATTHFWHSLAVMAIGDLGGGIIILGALFWINRLFQVFRMP
jgi:hypothetical protein